MVYSFRVNATLSLLFVMKQRNVKRFSQELFVHLNSKLVISRKKRFLWYLSESIDCPKHIQMAMIRQIWGNFTKKSCPRFVWILFVWLCNERAHTEPEQRARLYSGRPVNISNSCHLSSFCANIKRHSVFHPIRKVNLNSSSPNHSVECIRSTQTPAIKSVKRCCSIVCSASKFK